MIEREWGVLRRQRGALIGWMVRTLVLTGGILACPDVIAADSRPNAEGLRKTAQWDWPDPVVYQQYILSFLDQRDADDQVRNQVARIWGDDASSMRGPKLLDAVLDSGAAIDQRVAALVSLLRNPAEPPIQPKDIPWLTSDIPGWLQDAVRIACARGLAQNQLYDEALQSLSGLEPQEVCAPATLLFYRAASEHHLLQHEACQADLELLFQREEELPVRYARVAKLMQVDVAGYEPESLDEVARLMRDVRRRLDLGRAGQMVRDEEQKIVEKLDKLIDDLEQQMKQQQQQQQQQQSNGSQQQSQAQPMEDSQIAGGSGPGDVDDKETGQRSGWGNLPPAQRQQALQRLTEELPSHYRDVIEGYFRELAKEDR